MSFVLQYAGERLFRSRWHIEWAMPMLFSRAKKLGWDGKRPLIFRDHDGHALGGFVPS